MTNPSPLFEIGQQSMLKIIRSARSRLGREQSADEERMHDPVSVQHDVDKAARRPGTIRAPAIGGELRHRLTRSKSSVDQGCQAQVSSENAAPEKQQSHPSTLGGGVLGEITNVVHGTILPAVASSDSFEKAFVVPMPPHEPGPSPPLPSAGSALIISHADYFDLDAHNANDPQQVMEYMFDIFRVLHREEELHLATPGYLERQPSVNEKMRGILVDWLVSVQLKYKLKAETLFLAISLLDRYLELKVTGRKQLQLVGVTAMLIAAKFEEMYPPQINDFVYVTDKAYAREDIINMEVSMLAALEFKICRPTPVHFLERYQCINGCTEAHRDLAQYLLELALVDYNMIKYTPSRLAAASILLSNKLLRRQPSWKPAAVKHTRFTEQMLKECAKEMCTLLEHAQQSPLQAVRKKFAQLKYHSVSKINFGGAPNHTVANEETRQAARRTIGGASGPRRSVGAGGSSDVQAFATRYSNSPTTALTLSVRPPHSARDCCPAQIDTIVSLA